RTNPGVAQVQYGIIEQSLARKIVTTCSEGNQIIRRFSNPTCRQHSQRVGQKRLHYREANVRSAHSSAYLRLRGPHGLSGDLSVDATQLKSTNPRQTEATSPVRELHRSPTSTLL